MDYFVELASVPDLCEAIKLDHLDPEPPAGKRLSKEAEDLLFYDFLREEHPSAWTAEVVQAFYKSPDFAARVWKNLRYCDTFRRTAAKDLLSDVSGMRLRAPSTWLGKPKLQEVDANAQQYVQAFSTAPDDAVCRYAEALQSKPSAVDEFCRKTGKHPEPPKFLSDLLKACGTPESQYEKKTRHLLAHPDQVRECARKTGIAIPFSMVLAQELEQIQETRSNVHRSGHSTYREKNPATSPPALESGAPIRRALNKDLLGLAFSGGGIRSATFNLGVLQALSKIGLLRQCDYLSTVSGGGYIGSWLTAWIRRESRTGQGDGVTMVDMQRRLSPIRSPNPMDDKVRPIRFLREYSNYLTPRSGFFSADTWTMIGIYVRNTLLNQVIIVSLAAAALMVPRIWFAMTQWLDRGVATVAMALFLWGCGIYLLIRNLRRLRPASGGTAAVTEPGAPPLDQGRPRWYARPFFIQAGVVLWLVAAALTAHHCGYTAVTSGMATASIVAGGIVFATLWIVLLLGKTSRSWLPVMDAVSGSQTRLTWAVRRAKLRAFFAISGSALVAGVVAAGLTWVLLRALSARAADPEELRWHVVAFGTAGLLSVMSLAIVAMLGMLGERFPDEHREWWSKFRTFIHVWAVGWLIAFLAAVYIPWGFQWFLEHYSLSAGLSALAAWIVSTLFGVQKGRTAQDDQKHQREAAGAGASMSARALQAAALVAPFVFIIGLVFAISIAIDRVFWANQQDYQNGLGEYWSFVTWTAMGASWPLTLSRVGDGAVHVPWTLTSAVALFAIGLLFSWRVDINEFSIHNFYKNRLVRCYLGASHTAERQADWFTGFDPKDDLCLQEFDHAAQSPPYPGPYPILNCALNLVGGQDLAWQERKSASFVFTPKYCGYDVDRAVLTKSHDGLSEDAYVPTGAFYDPGKGPFLGMAMAISGAAANPNMGRATSPALAFLMTVFNVRLGWWVGNPRKKKGVTKPSPRLGLWYTVLELFGGADDRKKFVNLSDGGHFENLGVYELIRRGCRYIVVCDAGQDGRFLGEDLATLVRQCRTDFGVEIDIAIDRICERSEAGLSQTHCVVGKIHYLTIPRRDSNGRLMNEDEGPLLRGGRPAHEEGYLIYIKPSLTGDEAQDLLEYSRRVPQFPHQSTADQWFNESQFESYRKLGMHIGEVSFSRYQDDDTKPLADLHQLFKRLHSYWYPPSLAINENSTHHVTEYSRIMEVIRTQNGLRNFDHTMFESLPDAGLTVDPRDEFYVCNALIQLIENVYADLDLEHLWEHPHVQGWMSVFERWAEQPAFRRTWRISERTYAERFRNFYNDRLRGRPLALPHAFIASHRGLGTADGYRENTIEAFKSVIRDGASVVELDVRKLASGELVLWHDDKVGKTPVAAMTLKALQSHCPHVVTLETCAKELRGLVQLDVELKVPGIEADVLEVLLNPGAQWRRRDFVLTSFYDSMIAEARKIDEKVRTGLLIDNPAAFDQALKNFLDIRSDFLAPKESCLTQSILDRAAEQGVPLVPWPVNDPKQLELFLRHETVAGIITDDVKRAVEVKKRL